MNSEKNVQYRKRLGSTYFTMGSFFIAIATTQATGVNWGFWYMMGASFVGLGIGFMATKRKGNS